jgi:unsaturated rhamnogalacturonyl hydrolase
MRRRNLLAATPLVAAGLAGIGGIGGVSATAADTDWSTAVVDSTTKRHSAASIGGWGYTVGLYLYGQYLVYKRTGKASYLSYIRTWADRFVGSDGSIDNSFNNLDSMQSGNILLLLYAETGQSKYAKAADKIRTRLNSYPRTKDGGFWHATSRQHQLWGDGTYMVLPFLVRYGAARNDATYANNEAAKQLALYHQHLTDPNGLLYHAYDEAAAQSWVVKGTHHSPESWCRAIGWYAMATLDVLDRLPATHPQRAALIAIAQRLVAGFARYQDSKTGRWFQVVDRGDLTANWTETSSSCMYTYATAKAIRRGYVDAATYQPVVDRGHAGVLAKVSRGSDGLTSIADICIGTNVGDLDFYLARPRATNDLHGLGSFLIMNEFVTHPDQVSW